MAATIQQFHEFFGSVKRNGIVEVFADNNPLLRGPMPLLNFIKVPGFTYSYNREGSLGGIAYRGLNQTYTPDVGVVNPQTERLVMFGGEANTDAALVEVNGNTYRAGKVAMKVKAASLFFLKEFFDGDSVANPLAMDGLNVRLTGNQVISAGDNGAALTLDMVFDLQQRVIGENSQKVLLMSPTQRKNLSNLVVAAAGGASVADAASQITSFNQSRIVLIEEDHQGNQILGQDETKGSDNATGSIYCCRFGSSLDEEFIQGLVAARGFDSEDQGKRSTVYIDLIDIYVGLALFHPRCAARLLGVKTALA